VPAERIRSAGTDGTRAHREDGRRLPFGLSVGVLGVATLASIVLSAVIGTADIAPVDAWRIMAHEMFGGGTMDWTESQARIVWDIRLPRAVLAVLVGGSLALSGVTLQAMVRNPMADPTILGGTSGAAVGAVGVLALGWTFGGQYALSLAAFLGCLGGFGLAFLLARSDRSLSPIRLVLAGIAVSYLLSAVTNLIIFLSGNTNAVRSAMFWMLGGLGAARWESLPLPALGLVGGGLFLLAQARPLNALLFGDETATSLGTPPDALRRRLFVVVALLTGLSVALAGGIGFVGLVVPHVARMLVGSDNRRVLGLAALLGAAFLLWADVLARVLIEPQELPIGVITALVGAPVFAALLRASIQRKERH
jgi:iron complex transport system permease protein